MTIWEGDMRYHKRYSSPKDKTTIIVLIAICVIVIIFGIIHLFTPKDYVLKPKMIGWCYTIQIQEYRQHEESGYSSPPSDAYDIRTSRRTRTRTVTDSDGKQHTETYHETYYEYKINRWDDSRTVVTHGLDKSPYWGEYTLIDHNGDLGSERVSAHIETYTVSGIISDESSELISIDVPKEVWELITLDDELNYKQRRVGKPYDISIAK